MAEKNANVWAPWRMEYIERLDDTGDDLAAPGCFLCKYGETPDQDAGNHVLWRSAQTIAVLNRYPYTNGHLLIAPTAHLARLEDLPDESLHEQARWIRDAKRVLEDVLDAQGFNVGLNLGRCAGAGLPGHVHWHIVPRWGGDTNFMAVLGAVRVIPQALQAVDQKFRARSAELQLPA